MATSKTQQQVQDDSAAMLRMATERHARAAAADAAAKRLEHAQLACADLLAEWVDAGCPGGKATGPDAGLVQEMIDARREWRAASQAFLAWACSTGGV